MNHRTGIEDHINMVWETKQGPVRLKNMDTMHIVNTLRTIQQGKGGSFCGHSSQDWLIAFKMELKRRNELGNRVFALFPKFNAEFNAVINGVDRTTKLKSFTTKGIKETAYAREIIPNREKRAKISHALSQQVKGNQKEKSNSNVQKTIGTALAGIC